jgi:hypothetical protein
LKEITMIDLKKTKVCIAAAILSCTIAGSFDLPAFSQLGTQGDVQKSIKQPLLRDDPLLKDKFAPGNRMFPSGVPLRSLYGELSEVTAGHRAFMAALLILNLVACSVWFAVGVLLLKRRHLWQRI